MAALIFSFERIMPALPSRRSRVFIRVVNKFVRVEPVKGFQYGVAFAQYGNPRKPRLHPVLY